MKTGIQTILIAMAFLGLNAAYAEPPSKIRIGFSTTLTGDGAISGQEMKNAAILANELIAHDAFEIIFEDERCLGAPAASAAQKLISIDKIEYAVGFFCNVSLLSAAPLYQKAGIPIISTVATTMDTADVGKDVYRLFPADQLSIPPLYKYVASRYKRVAILAEEDAYAQMLKKEFVRINSLSPTALTLIVEDYQFAGIDFRSQLTRLKGNEVEAIFISSATEPSFIRVVKQMHEMGLSPAIVGVYTPVSDIAIAELGELIEGAVAATLPDLTARSSQKRATELLSQYRNRFGDPKSAFPVIPTTLEGFRLLYVATQSQRSVGEVMRDPIVNLDSLIGPYSIDKYGAIQGLEFVLKKVTNLKPLILPAAGN